MLTIAGCIGILLGILHVFDMQIFSTGLSSGIRILGSIGIFGCLLSAVGNVASEEQLI